jgi:hypothetical protein
LRALFYGFALALAWATLYAGTHHDRKGFVAWLAFGILILAAAAQFYSALVSAAGPRASVRRRDATNVVKNRFGSLVDSGVISLPCSRFAVHVWMVPLWYRLLIPLKLRSFVRNVLSDESQARLYKPKLTRLVHFTLSQPKSSGVKFRKNYGLVGTCLALNRMEPLYVNFDEPPVAHALSGGAAHWGRQGRDVTHGLKFKDAESIANRYSQALASVIADDRSQEALGVVTFEVCTGTLEQETDIPTDDLSKNERLKSELVKIAGVLSPILAIRQPRE